MDNGTGDVGQQSKAINVAYAWATGWGLPVVVPEPGRADLVIGGKLVNVCRQDGKRCGLGRCVRPCGVVLNPDQLNSRNVNETLVEMYKVTDALGMPRPAPFRDSVGTLRASSDDYEAISMRQTPFERAPNPPSELLRRYERIVKREADCKARKYHQILRLMCLDAEDLRSIGMVYLCVYLGRHQDLRNEKKNGANLSLFLDQEFGRWATVTCKKLRNTIFSSAGVPLSELLGAPVPSAEFIEAGQDVEAAYVMPLGEEHPEQEVHFLSEEESLREDKRLAMQEGRWRKRRERAHAAELEDRLGRLTHEQYVEALSRVINEERHPVEARELAAERMKQHLTTCEPCRAADEAWTERQKRDQKLRTRSRVPREQHIPTIDDLEPQSKPQPQLAAGWSEITGT